MTATMTGSQPTILGHLLHANKYFWSVKIEFIIKVNTEDGTIH